MLRVGVLQHVLSLEMCSDDTIEDVAVVTLDGGILAAADKAKARKTMKLLKCHVKAIEAYKVRQQHKQLAAAAAAAQEGGGQGKDRREQDEQEEEGGKEQGIAAVPAAAAGEEVNKREDEGKKEKKNNNTKRKKTKEQGGGGGKREMEQPEEEHDEFLAASVVGSSSPAQNMCPPPLPSSDDQEEEEDIESVVQQLLEADRQGGGVGLVGSNGLGILPESELDWLIMRLAGTYLANDGTRAAMLAKGSGGKTPGGKQEEAPELLPASPPPPPSPPAPIAAASSITRNLPRLSLFSRKDYNDAVAPSPPPLPPTNNEAAILALPLSPPPPALQPPSASLTTFAPAHLRQQTLCGMLVSLHSEYSSFASQFHCMLLDTEKGKAAVGYLGNGSMVLCIWCSPVCTLGTIVSKFYTVHTNISHVFKDLYWNS
eukprot:GHVS01008817.1.p1 GENE.GHVS01008817.1~~GHVS01008817.1.p1  ORF type:complete len:428 (+),score=155.40 GHVS01008817.1:302-1585(+)